MNTETVNGDSASVDSGFCPDGKPHVRNWHAPHTGDMTCAKCGAATTVSDSASVALADAGYTPRDTRLECDECGEKFTAQMLPVHACKASDGNG